MSHRFGDLVSIHLARKHGLSQARLAAGIDQDPAVVSHMCRGSRLTGLQARERVLAIIDWFRRQDVLSTRAEADALLEAAGLARLDPGRPDDAVLVDSLIDAALPAPVHLSASGAGTPTNLPTPLTSFVGRQQMLKTLVRLLDRSRLVTLTGTGGVGKTRLAVQTGHHLLASAGRNRFPDGIWFVELASLAEPDLIPDAVAQSILQSGRLRGAAIDALCAILREKALLLILDNCEHMIGAVAPLAVNMLEQCRGLRILATSRESLSIAGEYVLAVEPFALPAGDMPSHAHDLDAFPAAQLLLDRLRTRQHDFAPDPDDWRAILGICEQVAGIPLALELAASRVPELTLQNVASQLDQQMKLLVSRYRTNAPRHRTMEAALDWSYCLLSPDGQNLLAHASVFAGGWTVGGAMSVAGIDDSHAVEMLLWDLVEKSLVIRAAHADDDQCFQMLEPVRQFAATRLHAMNATEQARRNHALYYLDLARRAEVDRDTGAEFYWLKRLQRETDNLRAAHRWGLAHGDALFAQSLVGNLFTMIYGADLVEASYWAEAALALGEADDNPESIQAEAMARHAAGHIAWLNGDLSRAHQHFDRELALRILLQEPRGIAAALRGQGVVARVSGDFERARDLGHEALRLSTSAVDPIGIAWAHQDLAALSVANGDLLAAHEQLISSLGRLQTLNMPFGLYLACLSLATIHRSLDQADAARREYMRALHMQQEAHFFAWAADALEGLGGLAADDGEYRTAAVLFGAAYRHRQATGTTRMGSGGKQYTVDLIAVQTALSVEAWDDALTTGHNMPIAEAVQFALDALDKPGTT